MAHWSKDNVLKFINLYKEEECLWKVKSVGYQDKIIREKAYRRLLLKARELDPTADREIIAKKIKNLHTVFRKEEKRVKDSMRPGASPDDVYTPRLWYYKDLEFLADQEECKQPVSSWSPERNDVDVQDSSNSQEFFNVKIEINRDENLVKENHSDTFFNENPPPIDTESPCSNTTYISTDTIQGLVPNAASSPTAVQKRRLPLHSDGRVYPRAKKRKLLDSGNGAQLLACEQQSIISESDKFDTFGQFVALNLREMAPEQYLNAQILISEVIYEGHMKTLSRDSKIVSQRKLSPPSGE